MKANDKEKIEEEIERKYDQKDRRKKIKMKVSGANVKKLRSLKIIK